MYSSEWRYRFFAWLRLSTVIPVLVFLSVSVALVAAMSEAMDQAPVVDGSSHDDPRHADIHFDFTAATSYFLPSLPTTEPSLFDPVTTNFGLISQAYDSDVSLPDAENATDWRRFAHHVLTLNRTAPDRVSYHVLYLARHGQGYHNLAVEYYGTQAWDCYYSLLEGDPDNESNITWADAQLSKLGREQARMQSKFWESQIRTAGMPVPERWYVSPMERACRTAEITFQPLQNANLLISADFVPTIKELLRETMGIHTCDRRSRKSLIAANYPMWKIEEGFTEEDELWDPVYRESNDAHKYRASLLLDDIFSSLRTEGNGTFLSLTAHGGMTNAILRAIRHREFQVNVGSAIAVLVKAKLKEGKRPTQHFGKGDKAPKCIGDPLKAGLPGYKDFKQYVDEVEGQVDFFRATAN